jgi:hypothetical protein
MHHKNLRSKFILFLLFYYFNGILALMPTKSFYIGMLVINIILIHAAWNHDTVVLVSAIFFEVFTILAGTLKK